MLHYNFITLKEELFFRLSEPKAPTSMKGASNGPAIWGFSILEL